MDKVQCALKTHVIVSTTLHILDITPLHDLEPTLQ